MEKDAAGIQPEQSVDALLSRYPQLAEVFVAHAMFCVGCTVSQFHTLAEVATIYNLDLALLLDELRQRFKMRDG